MLLSANDCANVIKNIQSNNFIEYFFDYHKKKPDK